MSASLRIDFLSNIAQLTAEMRSGKQELGSFQEQVQRFDRSFSSAKATAARAGTEQGSFAQNFIHPYLRPGELIPKIPDLRPDLALRRETRLKDLLPWGNATVTELSRDAAEKAAAIRDGGRKIGAALRESLREVTGHAAEMAGASRLGGMIGGAGRFLTSPLGAGAAALGAGAAAALVLGLGVEHTRQRFALERDVQRESLMTGQGAEDVSRLRAIGAEPMMVDQFLKSIANGSPALERLKIDAEQLKFQPIVESLSQLSASLDRLPTPADRVKTVMELFGRAGAEMLPVLDKFKVKLESVHPSKIVTPEEAAQAKARGNAWSGAWSGLGGAAGAPFEMLFGGKAGTWLGRRAEDAANFGIRDASYRQGVTARREAEDRKIENAEKINATTNAIARLNQARDKERAQTDMAARALRGITDEAYRLTAGDRAADRLAFQRSLPGELSGEKRRGVMAQWEESYDDVKARREEATERGALRDRRQQLNRRTMTPEQRRTEAEGAAKDVHVPQGWSDPEGNRRAYEQVQEIKRQAARDYYREVAQLDGQQLARELRGPGEVYQERVKWLRAAAKDPYSGVTKDMSERGVSRAGEDYRRGLGIKDPLGDYARQMTELRDALKAKQISPEQFDRRHKEMRQGTARDLAGEVREVSPMPALQRNSAEAYAAIAQAQVAAPEVQLLQGIATKLDASDQKLGILVAQGQGQQRPTDL